MVLTAVQWAPHGQGRVPMAQGTTGTWGKQDRARGPWGPTPQPWGRDKAQPQGWCPDTPSPHLCPSADTGQRPGAGRGATGSSVPHGIPPPQAVGLEAPRGSEAAIKVQLRFFAFGTMATFPTWLNYRAGCCLAGGWGGLVVRCSPEPGLQEGSSWEPEGPCPAP